ncbi:unnamed protein product, partial [Chrysoparadoxa australica]
PTPELYDEDSPTSMDLNDLEDDEETSFGAEESDSLTDDEENNFSTDNFESEEDSFESGDSFEEEASFDSGESFDSNEEFDSGESFGAEEDFTSEEEDEEEDNFRDSPEMEEEEDLEENQFDNDDDENDQFQSDYSEEENTFQEEESSPSDFQLPDPDELEKQNQEQAPPVSAAPFEDQGNIFSEREKFQDLRDFGNAITYGVVKTGGNPPFSLILRNIKTVEDAEDIKILLNEHGLVSPDNEEAIDQGLEQGSLLISQISEYSAVYLAHKMRRYDVEIRIGLSDQLHPSKSYTREGRGLVSKYNLHQNKSESLETENHSIEIEDIKLATTPTLDGYVIRHYLQVVTSHSLVEEDELRRLHQISNSSSEFSSQDEVELDNILEQFPKDELDEDMEPFDLGLNEVYRELVEDLRNQAYKLEANAVVGINFNITPMVFQRESSKVHYKITCSGNAVWVVDHQ